MPTNDSYTETRGGVVAGRALRIAAESSVGPGSSLILDGKIASGVAHLAVGMLARSVFGPLGWALVAANSYSKSVNGRGLLEKANKE